MSNDDILTWTIIKGANNPKLVASLRIKALSSDGVGFPRLYHQLLADVWCSWYESLSEASTSKGNPLSTDPQTVLFRSALLATKNICTFDRTLNVELGHEGLHTILSNLLKVDAYMFENEEDQDKIMELQDIACEIAALAPSFPARVAPFSKQELEERLPLMFSISPVPLQDSTEGFFVSIVLINQVTKRQGSQADVGFLMWPSAVVLSRFLATNPEMLRHKSVLELGSGCGLTGLVAANIQTRFAKDLVQIDSEGMILTDFNKIVVENCAQNIALNGLQTVARSEELDFYKQDATSEGWVDGKGVLQPQVDLILAADVICQPEDAFAAARTISCSLKRGGSALFVSADSKHRFGVEKLEEACREVGLCIRSTNVRDLYDGQLLAADMEKTAGFVSDMSLTLYSIEKN